MTNDHEKPDSVEDQLEQALQAVLRGQKQAGRSGVGHGLAHEVFDLIERVRRFEKDSSDPGSKETPHAFSNTIETAEFSDYYTRGIGDDEIACFGRQLTVGRFEIIRTLGEGGNGIVFLARDPKLDREVALKIPRPDRVLDPETRNRFLREAKAAAMLSHPNIVPAYEIGELGTVVYIVNQYIDGPTLAERIAQSATPLRPKAATAILVKLADAVQHAHSRGVLHRDLKPANILFQSITHSPERTPGSDAKEDNSIPLISDFGLAKLLGEDMDVTREGAVIGTPNYMSPEQAGGSSETGTGADIYSLGAILYRLITGQNLFGKLSLTEMLQAIQHDDPPRPRTIDATIPKDLEAICLKCLEKQSDHRYASAYELQQDLQRFLDGMPIHARRSSSFSRFGKWTRRYPALATSICVLATVLVVGLITVSLLLRNSNQLLLSTEKMRLTAVDSASDLRYAIDDMLLALAEMPEIETAGFESVRANLLQRVNGFYERFTNTDLNDPELRRQYSRLLLNMARLRSRLGDPDGSIEAARQLLSLQPAIETSTPDEIQLRIDLLLLLGKQLAVRSRDESKVLVETARELSISPQASRADDQQANIDMAMTLEEIANFFGDLGERTMSRQFMADSIEYWDLVDWDQINDDETALAYGQTLLSAAITNAGAESAVDASRHCRAAVEFFESRVLEQEVSDEILYALARSHRVMSFLRQREPAAAMQSITRATELLSELCIRHPVVPKYAIASMDTEYSRGLILHLDKQYDEAAEVFEDNIDYGDGLVIRFEADTFQIHARLSDNLTMLGIVRGYQERYEEQLEVFEQSKILIGKQYPGADEHNDQIVLTAGADGEIGKCLAKLNRTGEAVSVLNDSIEQLQIVLERDPDNGQARRFRKNNLNTLANCLAQLQRWEDAIVTLTETLDDGKSGFPVGEQDRLATWLLQSGNWEDALEAAEAFHRSCLGEKKDPEHSAHLASQLLAITDSLAGRHEIDTEISAVVVQRLASMGLDAVIQMVAIADERDSVLAQIDESDRLSRLRQTTEFEQWQQDR